MKNPELQRFEKSSKEWLEIGHIRFEKCDLEEAKECFETALEVAREQQDLKGQCESLVALLRYSGEVGHESLTEFWIQKLDHLIRRYGSQVSPIVWYGKGSICIHQRKWKEAQIYYHRFLREIRKEVYTSESNYLRDEARALSMLCNCLQQRGFLRRAQRLADEIETRFAGKGYRGIDGVIYLLLGNLAERRKELGTAMHWFQKAHTSFLSEHNWYHHLYALYGYARISRLKRNFSQAHWYLDLIDKTISQSGFFVLKKEIDQERKNLKQESFDILIDVRHARVKTGEGREISLKKQHVLLSLLHELSLAYSVGGRAAQVGLTKAELIEKVWRHKAYHSGIHDNKLYYNINRLRKLIEPNSREPKYVQNFRDGYRFAPGLRVNLVQPTKDLPAKEVH